MRDKRTSKDVYGEATIPGKYTYCKKRPQSTRDWRKAKNVEYFNGGYLSTTLNKSLQTSSETNFPLIQAFKWSQNNFGEFTYPNG